MGAGGGSCGRAWNKTAGAILFASHITCGADEQYPYINRHSREGGDPSFFIYLVFPHNPLLTMYFSVSDCCCACIHAS